MKMGPWPHFQTHPSKFDLGSPIQLELFWFLVALHREIRWLLFHCRPREARHGIVPATGSLVGGLEHEFYFSVYWECHDPNWM